MNTPAHLLLGAAAFGRPMSHRVTAAALIGAMIPDLSLYVMGGVALFILGISPEVVFRDLYFSDAWQQVFAIDNSFILWGIALGLAIWRKSRWAIALCGAALLHIALDFPLHADDARMHFWPLTDWKFISPISYWESSKGGQIVGAIEMVLVVAVTIYLLRQHVQIAWRLLFVVLCVMQVLPAVAWALNF